MPDAAKVDALWQAVQRGDGNELERLRGQVQQPEARALAARWSTEQL